MSSTTNTLTEEKSAQDTTSNGATARQSISLQNLPMSQAQEHCLEHLQSIHHSVVTQGNEPKTLFITGASGCGKTFVLQTWWRELQKQREQDLADASKPLSVGSINNERNTSEATLRLPTPAVPQADNNSNDGSIDDLTLLRAGQANAPGERTLHTGPSGLSNTASNESESNVCLFSMSKFEQENVEPFSTLCTCLTSLTQQLLPQQRLWRRRLMQDMSEADLELLKSTLIPGLKVVLDEKSNSSDNFSNCSSDVNNPLYQSFHSAIDDDIYAGEDVFDDFGSNGGGGMNDASQHGGPPRAWAFDQLRLAVREYIQTLAHYQPVVLILDDIQWCRDSSWHIFRTLLKDMVDIKPKPAATTSKVSFSPSTTNFTGKRQNTMSNAVSSLSRLSQVTRMTSAQQLIQKKKCKLLLVSAVRTPLPESLPQTDFIINCPRLTLPSWTSSDLKQMVKLALHRDETQSLVEVLVEKTKGNAFDVLQAFRCWENLGLLYYSEDDDQWEWNLEEINRSPLSQCVSKMLRKNDGGELSPVQSCLAAAACLGLSEFHITTVYHAIAAVNPVPSIKALKVLLEEAEKDHYIEPVEGKDQVYRFCHDQLRKQAYSWLPDDNTWHLQIARQLRLWIHACSEDGRPVSPNILLQCVSQFQMSVHSVSDQWERLDVAELHAQAAHLAARKLCYGPACEFLAIAIRLLGKKGWQSHSVLMFEWYGALVQYEYCHSRFDRCLKRCDVLLDRQKQMLEKESKSKQNGTQKNQFKPRHSVYYTKVLCLLQTSQLPVARELIISILSELNCQLPNSFHEYHFSRQYKRMRKTLQKTSDESLLRLPQAKDEPFTPIAEFSDLLRELVEMEGSLRDIQLSLVLLHVVQLTLDHGYCSLTQIVFISWAWLMTQQGFYKDAIRFGRIGLQFADKGLDSQHDTRAIVLYYYYCHHWQYPYRECIRPMKDAIETLWKDGALTMVLSDSIAYLRLRYLAGCSLPQLLEEVKKYADLLTHHQHNYQKELNLSFFQAISTLVGNSEDPLSMTGDFMDYSAKVLEWEKSKNSRALQMSYYHLMELAFLFGDLTVAAEHGNKLDSAFKDGCHLWTTNTHFLLAMIYLGLFKRTGMRKHKRRSDSHTKKIKEWVKSGVVNCLHLLLIIQAETLAITNKSNTAAVCEAFNKAIETADYSCIHHQALACEFAAAYCYSNGDDSYKMYLKKCLMFYGQWGAGSLMAKVESQYPTQDIEISHVDITGESPANLLFRKSIPSSTNTDSLSEDVWSKWNPHARNMQRTTLVSDVSDTE